MKIGDTINFYLFSEEVQGEIINVNKKEKTIMAVHEGYKYTVQTFTKLPKKKSDIPPWYMLTNQNKPK